MQLLTYDTHSSSGKQPHLDRRRHAQAMGIAVELGPEGVARCIREAGVGFMMAPRYHPAMAAVVPVRRSLKVSLQLCWSHRGQGHRLTLVANDAKVRSSLFSEEHTQALPAWVTR